MIVWKPDPTVDRNRSFTAVQAMLKASVTGQYALMAYVPGAGWSVAVGSYDSRNSREESVVTKLVDDRHVQICAFSKPDGGDNPDPGERNHAA